MELKSKLKIFCLAFLLLDLVVAAVLVGSVLNNRQSYSHQRDALAKRIGVTEDMSAELQGEKFAQATGEAARLVSMYSEVTLQDGEIPLYLSNDEENNCSVSVEIVLFGTDTVLAESGTIEPGWRLERLPLKRELEKGEYMCLVRCSFYTMEGNVFLGSTGKQLLLRVN